MFDALADHIDGSPLTYLLIVAVCAGDALLPLFRYADDCAGSGRLWTTFRSTEDGGSTVGGMAAETQKVPCPADDAFIRYFASR